MFVYLALLGKVPRALHRSGKCDATRPLLTPMNCGIWEYSGKAGDLINNIEVLREAMGVFCESSDRNSQEATGVTPMLPIKHKILILQDRDIQF